MSHEFHINLAVDAIVRFCITMRKNGAHSWIANAAERISRKKGAFDLASARLPAPFCRRSETARFVPLSQKQDRSLFKLILTIQSDQL